MIGYARLLVARNIPNYSTIPDFYSVITLGKHLKQPLIRPSSELADRLEPHDLIYSAVPVVRQCWVPGGGVAGVYPGWGLGGYQEGAIPGTQPTASLRPD